MLLRTTTFDCSALINSPIERVFETVAEPTNLVGLQPLLVRCEVVKKEVSADLGNRSYELRFIERFHLLGPIHYDNKLRVHLDVKSEPRQVEFHVKVFPRLQLHSSYSLAAQPGGTLVRESVQIECLAFMASFAFKTARAAHEKLLANLKRKLEGAA